MVAMNEELLTDIGLNSGQAKAYLLLIRSGEQTVPDLVEKLGESRTNTYMILEKLEEMGLVTKHAKPRKTTYRANNPTTLEKLTESRRKTLVEAENRVKASLPQMLSYYYTFAEEPGVRLFQGKDELVKIYEDILRTKQTMYMVRTPQEKITQGKELIQKFIRNRVKLGIELKTITPYRSNANKDPQIDKEQLLDRTFFPEEVYDAPVELDIYGDKVAFQSFGEELTGVIIDSPQISKAMRQIFAMAQVGAQKLFEDNPKLVADLKKARAELSASPIASDETAPSPPDQQTDRP
jgi:sugar-specific transcriptional regulator TrmB